jgi:methyl-accepting chemotaxis protein
MTLLRNLPVAMKLGLSSGLAVLMLVGLVVLVREEAAGSAEAQQAQVATTAAYEGVAAAMLGLMEGTSSQRGALMGQTPDAVQSERRTAREAMERSGAAAAAAESRLTGEMRGRVEALRRDIIAYASGVDDSVAQRLRLLEARDTHLLPRMPEYDQAMEAITANLGFSLQGDALENARDVLNTYATAMADVRIGISRYLATNESAIAARVRRAASQSQVHARRLEGAMPEALRTDVRRLTTLGEEIGRRSLEVLAIGQEIDTIRSTRTAPVRVRVMAQGSEIQQVLKTESTAAAARASESVSGISTFVLAAGAGVALLLLVSSLLTTLAISVPLKRLSGAVTRIAGGDTAEPVSDQGRRDEIGRIAEALEALRGTVGTAFAQGQMLEQMSVGVMSADPNDDFRITYMNPHGVELARGIEHAMSVKADELVGSSISGFHRDLEQQRGLFSDPNRLPHRMRIKAADQVLDMKVSAIRDAAGNYVSAMLIWSNVTAQAKLADSFEAEVGGVVQALATSVKQMRQGVETVSQSADTSGREADAVAEVSAQAGQDVQAVAASAEELAASVAEITRQVTEGAQVARSAAEEARATDATVQGLVQSAAKIGDVVRLISDIAGQTNLLALNATIEAARAGEAGKGFAVVASEVKNLASQTAKATEEIAAQIGAIQTTTDDAAKALRNIGATIDRMNEVTTAIAGAVEEQGAATREIARSAAQVAEGTGAVVRRIDDVRRAAGDTGGAARNMRDSAEALTAQADALRGKADSFLANVRAS